METLALILGGVGVMAFAALALLVALAHVLLPVFIILWIMKQ